MKYKYNGQWYDLTLPAFDSLPVGSEIGYWGNTIPNNYLEEDGKQYLIVDYPELFNVIGHTYDLPTDNDSTKFRVPNNCGRVGVGLDNTQTEFDTLGETGGSKYLQEHTHKWANANGRVFVGANNNWITINNGTQVSFPSADDTAEYTGGVRTGTDGVSTGDSGNLQPYIVKKYLIKAHPSAVNTSEVVNEHSTSETDVYSCNYVNTELAKKQDKGTLLWTNSNIGVVQAPQTISFGNNTYSYYDIVIAQDSAILKTQRVFVGDSAVNYLLENNFGGYTRTREIQVNASSIVLGAGKFYSGYASTSEATNNSQCIIYKIYGYK